MSRLILILLSVCLWLTGSFGPAAGEGEVRNAAPEYLVKAAFVYNFAKFIEWPEGTFRGPEEPFILCLFGEDEFGNVLKEFEDRTVRGRPFRMRHCATVEDLSGCHIIFIGRAASEAKLNHALAFLEGRGVLTVGENEGFARRGGIIELFEVQNRIRFRINPAAARRAGLRISSDLLRLADIVKESPGNEDP